ncbi:MAG: SUMF1/EgtB/PvdO family nonheme iron enzyme [Bacteroidota bacterium]|nr:SUMF1/EgtB/PvdO family nonheme iron enzyme [Bacteroidota bacterium]
MKVKRLLMRLAVLSILYIGLSSSGLPDINKDYVKFGSKLYASKHELRNFEYREFLNDLKLTKQNDKFSKCLYDSTQWLVKFKNSYNEPMTNMYHWHLAYDNYPVVNVTKEAADLYCEWLTTKYNNQTKKKFKKVVFRLPTEIEWKKLSSPLLGHNLPWYGNYLYENDKTPLANIKVMDYVSGKTDYVSDGGFHTIVTGHYKANKLGIFDVIGNVAEMTQNGIIKGGSWDNFLDECTIDKSQKFDLPDPRVGFRVIMEVIEE